MFVPLITIAWVSQFLVVRPQDAVFLVAVATCRGYRWAWQNPLDALVEAAITSAILESVGSR